MEMGRKSLPITPKLSWQDQDGSRSSRVVVVFRQVRPPHKLERRGREPKTSRVTNLAERCGQGRHLSA